MFTLSFIIPVYNNSDILGSNLPFLIEELEKKKYDFEIVIVDDGSKNQFIINELAKKFNANYIGLKNNRGKGAAVREGMINSNGKFRIFTDADIPYDFDSINNIIYNLESGNADIVTGDRTLVNSEYYKKLSFLRKIVSKFFSLMVGGLIKNGLNDTQCGLKGFTADTAISLFSKSRINGFAFDVEILYLAGINNFRIQKVPVKLRTKNSSSVRVIKHGIMMIFDLIKIKKNQIFKLY